MNKNRSQQLWDILPEWIRHILFRKDSDESTAPDFLLLKVVVICFAGIFLCAIALGGRPIYSAAVSWRAHSLAAKAVDLIGKKNVPDAFAAIRSASQLRPGDPVVMRATALILEKIGDPLSIDFRKQVAFSPAATMEDRRLYVRDSIEKGLVDPKVEEQIQFLLQKEPGNAVNWLFAARLYELCGLNDQMFYCARHSRELDIHFEEATFFLATQLLKSPGTSPEGINLLWILVRDGGESSLPAAMILARKTSLSQEDAGLLITRLKTDPQSKEIHKLEALNLAIKIHPEERNHLIDAAIQSLPAGDDEALHELALWLNSHGEAERTLAVIPQNLRAKSRSLLLVYLDAMAAMKQWQEIDTLVSTQGVPLDPAIVELFKARCATELGRKDDAVLHWRAAQSATAGNPEQAFYIANYAAQFGRVEQAKDIYRSLTQDPTTARAAYIELLHLESTHGDTASVYDVLRQMHQRWTKDEDVLNDYTYFSLLLELNVEQNLETARALVKSSPDKMAHRTTLALALLRMHDPSAALEVYDGLEIDWNNQPVSYKAIYAAVLRNNGRTEEAARVMATLKTEELRPEEKALVQ